MKMLLQKRHFWYCFRNYNSGKIGLNIDIIKLVLSSLARFALLMLVYGIYSDQFGCKCLSVCFQTKWLWVRIPLQEISGFLMLSRGYKKRAPARIGLTL